MPLPQDVYAAVIVPRDSSDQLNEAGFRSILEFLRDRGLNRVAVNGATGEYCLTTPDELARMMSVAQSVFGGGGTVLCGIGAPSLARSVELGRIAIQAGAKALLLPMPYFFPYAQGDLDAFCRNAASALDFPILLYNLPSFTTPLAPETVRGLLDSVPNLIGIKDSSGTFNIFRALQGTSALRIVGDDRVLVQALGLGLCDAVVSGVAGVLPELIDFLFHQRASAQYNEATLLLNELVAQLSGWPVPWGLKLIAGCRGVIDATFAQPLSPIREAQACAFQSWFAGWWPRVESAVKTS